MSNLNTLLLVMILIHLEGHVVFAHPVQNVYRILLELVFGILLVMFTVSIGIDLYNVLANWVF